MGLKNSGSYFPKLILFLSVLPPLITGLTVLVFLIWSISFVSPASLKTSAGLNFPMSLFLTHSSNKDFSHEFDDSSTISATVVKNTFSECFVNSKRMKIAFTRS